MPVIAVILAALTVVAVAAPARAQDADAERAREYVLQAADLIDVERYAEAIGLLESAIRLNPEARRAWFYKASCHAALEEWDAAAEALDRFETFPLSARQETEAEELRGRIDAARAPPPEPAPGEEPAPAEAPAPAEEPAPETSPTPRPAPPKGTAGGLGVAVGGAAALGVGVVVVADAYTRVFALDCRCGDPYRRLSTQHDVGAGVAIGGGVAVGVGLVAAMVASREGAPATAWVAPDVVGGGLSFGVAGRW